MDKRNSGRELSKQEIQQEGDITDGNHSLECASCLDEYNDSETKYLCINCDDVLCHRCKQFHKRSKVTKSHEIKKLCRPCAIRSNTEEAVYHCSDCNDCICSRCATEHKHNRQTKGHNLSRYNSSSIRSVDRNMEKGNRKENVVISLPNRDQPECFICEHRQGSCSRAQFSCNDCTLEFCNTCIISHLSIKRYEHHNVERIETTLDFVVVCVLCGASNGINMLQFWNCENCRMVWCRTCYNQCERIHKKICKDHQIVMIRSRSWQDKMPVDEKISKRTIETKSARNTDDSLTSVYNGDKGSDDEEVPTEYFGKPYVENVQSDSALLRWDFRRGLFKDENFIIIFKEKCDNKWKELSSSKSELFVDGLNAESAYYFRVKCVNTRTGDESKLSAVSELVCTPASSARPILQKCRKISNEVPCVYKIKVTESERDERNKTRNIYFGSPVSNKKARKVLLVGETGSGKSTVINAFANYILGVTWGDPFRLHLVNLTECEKKNRNDQAISQTEWITCYTLYNDITRRINYTVQLIDTPGFGDTRGIEQDRQIFKQINDFVKKPCFEIHSIDAVCLFFKAPDTRLTDSQRYVFRNLIQLFGSTIAENICIFITFADDKEPPVLSTIKAARDIDIPVERYFTFNNSALLATNNDVTSNTNCRFWQMGMKSCKSFFDILPILSAKTSLVVSKRSWGNGEMWIKSTMEILETEINLGLSNIESVTMDKDIIKHRLNEINTITISSEKSESTGSNLICTECSFTCYLNCDHQWKKEDCYAFYNGKCTHCPKACDLKFHNIVYSAYHLVVNPVRKKYSEIRDKYPSDMSQMELEGHIGKDLEKRFHKLLVMLNTHSKLYEKFYGRKLSWIQCIDVHIKRCLYLRNNEENTFGIKILKDCKRVDMTVKVYNKGKWDRFSTDEVASFLLDDIEMPIIFKLNELFKLPEIDML